VESERLANEGAATGDRRRAVQGLRWVGSARLLSQCVTWGLTAVTVRLLQPGDYGLVATAGLFTILATMVMDGGLSPMLISRRDVSSRVQGAATVGVFLLSSVFAVAIALAAPVGAAFFRNQALVAVLRVASLQLPLSALSVVPFALLSKEMHFGRIAVVQTASSIAQGLATLAMAYWGEAYWALIYGTLFGSAIRACGLWLALKDRPSLNWRLWELRPILQNSVHMVGQRLLYFVSADFDTFILSRLSGAVELGPYSLARTLSHAALDQISGTVNQVTLPSFAAKAGDQIAQLGALRVMLALTAAIVFPLFWLLGAISPTAFPLVFGPRWSALVFPFTAFTLMLPLRTVYALVDTAVIGTGNTSTTFKNMIVWASIMIPILLLGAIFGARGEAVAWVVGFPLVFVSAMHRISRCFGITLRDILRPLLAPALCAASTAGVVWALALIFGPMLPPLVLLAIEVMLAAGLYWLLMVRFGRSHYDQVMGLAWQLLGR
jgi:teichuronic acid exporter